MTVNYYYSDELTSDTEGNLTMLCRECARKNANIVQWASRGDEESTCELCRVANDQHRAAMLDAIL